MNDKVMNVFNKNNEQLDKELARRGLPCIIQTPCYGKKIISRDRAIAEIIYKDAYDAGIIEGKKLATASGNAKPDLHEYCLYDIDDGIRYRLILTEEQVSAIEWLINQGFLSSVEFSEWDDPFEDIGRI